MMVQINLSKFSGNECFYAFLLMWISFAVHSEKIALYIDWAIKTDILKKRFNKNVYSSCFPDDFKLLTLKFYVE